jgi:surface antigen
MTRFLLPLLALVLVAPAYAINMSGFREAPITRLNNAELKAFRTAVNKALDETPDGTTVEWKAPTTRFTSKITPNKTFADGKRKCREAIVESDAHDRYQRGLYTFCKGEKGDWDFKSPRPATKKK